MKTNLFSCTTRTRRKIRFSPTKTTKNLILIAWTQPNARLNFDLKREICPSLLKSYGSQKCSFATKELCDGLEGLSVVLRRFAYPCRYSDLIPRFGRPVPELSMISSKVVDFIYDEHNHRLTQWNNNILNPRLMEQYAYAIQERGAALENCFGFMDGTVRPISRPNENQRLLYNGHKRVHALNFESVAIPSSLIAHLYGPLGKSLNDFSIFVFVFPVTHADRGENNRLAFS